MLRQNLVCAFAYNASGISVAGGALYPLMSVLLSPMVAALGVDAPRLAHSRPSRAQSIGHWEGTTTPTAR